MRRLVKRSINLAGHATSVALEPEFWAALDDLAGADAIPLSALIARIDAERDGQPLASASRLAALAFVARR